MTDVSFWNDNVQDGKIRLDHAEGVDRDLFERIRKAMIGAVDDEIDGMEVELGALEMPK
jgi:hypothetical protein